jgi:hypothetical protein
VGVEKREEARRLVEEAGPPGSEDVGVVTASGAQRRGGRSDVEELREVLRSVSEFVRDLEEPIERLLNTLMSALDGSKLGEEVAAFYRKLRESGVPEDMAAEMTREYFRARIEPFSLGRLLSKALRGEAGEEGERS